jgi:hypothetical protein
MVAKDLKMFPWIYNTIAHDLKNGFPLQYDCFGLNK